MSPARLPDRCMSDDDIRRTLEPHVFDGTAIAKILKLKYAGAVHLDAVVDLLSPDP
jgi:hypothetical protein